MPDIIQDKEATHGRCNFGTLRENVEPLEKQS